MSIRKPKHIPTKPEHHQAHPWRWLWCRIRGHDLMYFHDGTSGYTLCARCGKVSRKG